TRPLDDSPQRKSAPSASSDQLTADCSLGSFSRASSTRPPPNTLPKPAPELPSIKPSSELSSAASTAARSEPSRRLASVLAARLYAASHAAATPTLGV